MARNVIKFEGLYELQKGLKKNITLDHVKDIVKQNGAEMQERMQEKADFKKGYQTGTTKRSIGLDIVDAGLTADVAPTTEYSPYLEFSTRFMEAQPFVRPSFEEQVEIFKKDMAKLVK